MKVLLVAKNARVIFSCRRYSIIATELATTVRQVDLLCIWLCVYVRMLVSVLRDEHDWSHASHLAVLAGEAQVHHALLLKLHVMLSDSDWHGRDDWQGVVLTCTCLWILALSQVLLTHRGIEHAFGNCSRVSMPCHVENLRANYCCSPIYRVYKVLILIFRLHSQRWYIWVRALMVVATHNWRLRLKVVLLLRHHAVSMHLVLLLLLLHHIVRLLIEQSHIHGVIIGNLHIL